MLKPRRQLGFTLLELMIGIAIIALVLGLGIPTLQQWMQDSQNRRAAESIANGLQMARSEAVGRNALVRFDLTNANGVADWKVTCVNDMPSCPTATPIRTYVSSGNARVGVSKIVVPAAPAPDPFAAAIAYTTELPAGVTFNGLGRVPTTNAGADITRIDVTADQGGKRFVVTVSNTGQVRMCDPSVKLSVTPQGCR
ncbi:GspH/FimT family pseudopilin [Massilia sp. CF038]|uniref:GspH/FimT family pseudopilin n=1 Tax=Massilia sp. CF038 TaxID=1881045 RepID=UPI00092196D4|nr:GspH/FimT family pseudopilin [Massilia sp. CF038]SHG58493.1 type IV fimbrial biogenesis protein FimT [Massilia sp. CF038]